MELTLTQNSLLEEYLGFSRHDCIECLSAKGIDSITFGHWLAIPSQHRLLIFRNQQCIALDNYQSAA